MLIKGGHRSGSALDVLLDHKGLTLFDGKRVHTRHTHGTGCTYSAAITAGLALGQELVEAVRRAKSFVQSAIETAPGFGEWSGSRQPLRIDRLRDLLPPALSAALSHAFFQQQMDQSLQFADAVAKLLQIDFGRFSRCGYFPMLQGT